MRAKKNETNGPTTYELAKIAATLCPGRQNLLKLQEAAHQAFQLWHECNRILSDRTIAQQQIRELRAGLFRMTPEEWRHRKDSFSGPQAELDSALAAMYRDADHVRKQLYRDKNLSGPAREKLWNGLLDFALRHDIPLPGQEHLSKEDRERFVDAFIRPAWTGQELDAHLIRYAVAARQKQLSANKSRY